MTFSSVSVIAMRCGCDVDAVIVRAVCSLAVRNNIRSQPAELRSIETAHHTESQAPRMGRLES